MIGLIVVLGILCAVWISLAIYFAQRLSKVNLQLFDAKQATTTAYREADVMRDALAELQEQVRQKEARRHLKASEAVRKGNITRKARKEAA